MRKEGTTLRVTPYVARLDVPLHDVNDLPGIARRLEELAFKLKAAHQSDHLNENGRLSDAYSAIRSTNQTLKKENPRV